MKFRKPLELTYEKEGVEYLIYIFQGGAGKYEFKTIKAVTVAFRLVDNDFDVRYDDDYDTWYEGASACSNRDEYSVNEGIVKAVGRADSSYYLDATGDENSTTFQSYEDSAVDHAIKTAKRIDKRNEKKREKNAVFKLHFNTDDSFWVDCEKGSI